MPSSQNGDVDSQHFDTRFPFRVGNEDTAEPGQLFTGVLLVVHSDDCTVDESSDSLPLFGTDLPVIVIKTEFPGNVAIRCIGGNREMIDRVGYGTVGFPVGSLLRLIGPCEVKAALQFGID